MNLHFKKNTFVTLFKTGTIFAILKQDKNTFSLKNE